jgi:hypothetical protein
MCQGTPLYKVLSGGSFNGRKTEVLRSHSSHKTAMQSTSEDNFPFADHTSGICRTGGTSTCRASFYLARHAHNNEQCNFKREGDLSTSILYPPPFSSKNHPPLGAFCVRRSSGRFRAWLRIRPRELRPLYPRESRGQACRPISFSNPCRPAASESILLGSHHRHVCAWSAWTSISRSVHFQSGLLPATPLYLQPYGLGLGRCEN